jgi:aspartate aminotransferase
MTGWRLGYTVAAEPWMTGLRKTLLYSTNGVSTPTQWAGIAALTVQSTFLEESLEAYRKRRDLMLTGLNGLGLKCASPSGAFYAFPDVTMLSHDSQEAADILLQRAKVATVPGIVFGAHGEGHLRFSFSTSLETIESALESMRKNL